MNPATFLCQPDVFNYLPPPSTGVLAKPALTFSPKDPSPWPHLSQPPFKCFQGMEAMCS